MKSQPEGHDNEATDSRPDDDEQSADKPLGRDERVSFYPMDPEEVLKKLLRTPPVQRSEDGSTVETT
jgi:hypothetical protein